VEACVLSFFLLLAVQPGRFAWTFSPGDTSLGFLEPIFRFSFFILILLLLPLTYFFLFLPVLTDTFLLFRNGGYLDGRWGNTSIILRLIFPHFLLSLFDHWSWMAGLLTIGQKRERVVVWIGLHWHGDWIGMGSMVDGGGGEVRTLYCVLLSSFTLWAGLCLVSFLFVSCLCNWDYLG
jgi:hypothetical protein